MDLGRADQVGASAGCRQGRLEADGDGRTGHDARGLPGNHAVPSTPIARFMHSGQNGIFRYPVYGEPQPEPPTTAAGEWRSGRGTGLRSLGRGSHTVTVLW